MIPEWKKEPSSEECSTNKPVYEDQERIVIACWYPQMGGYVGKCLVDIWKSRSNECFEAYVWHDGEWPFSEEERGRSPAKIHHCMAEQFVNFGTMIAKEQEKLWKNKEVSIER